MTLAELAAKAAALPECRAFEWPGAEHFHDDVFKQNVQTLPQAIKYIDQLRKRMAEYSMALDDLGAAYRSMRLLLIELNIEGLKPPRKRNKIIAGLKAAVAHASGKRPGKSRKFKVQS